MKNGRSGKAAAAAGTGLLLAIATLGPVCDERVPVYQDPRDVFSGWISVTSSTPSAMSINLVARNDFDETLEGEAVLRGEAEISLLNNPSIRKSFAFSPGDLITGKFNSTTGTLRVDPGDTIRLRVFWDYVDEAGVNLTTDYFRYWEDPDCPSRCIAEEEVFVLRGTLKVFDKTETISMGPTLFSLCHVSVHVPPQFCPPVDYTVECAKRAVTTGPITRRCP